MTVLRWGEFGDVAVQMMAQVKPGENLLILADTWTDMEIAEACLIAGINAKANAQLLVIPRMSHTDTREFNPSTAGAIQGADVIVAVCETMFIEKAARAHLIEGAEEILASDPSTFRSTFYELLELATRRGAETLGIDGEVRSLEPGKKADIITINMHNPYLTPTKNPFTNIVLYGSSRDVDTVIVDGHILKKDGVLTSIDVKQALATAQGSVEQITGRFFQEHPEQRQTWEQKAPWK